MINFRPGTFNGLPTIYADSSADADAKWLVGLMRRQNGSTKVNWPLAPYSQAITDALHKIISTNDGAVTVTFIRDAKELNRILAGQRPLEVEGEDPSDLFDVCLDVPWSEARTQLQSRDSRSVYAVMIQQNSKPPFLSVSVGTNLYQKFLEGATEKSSEIKPGPAGALVSKLDAPELRAFIEATCIPELRDATVQAFDEMILRPEFASTIVARAPGLEKTPHKN